MNAKLSLGLIALLLLIKCTLGDHKPVPFKGCPVFNINKRVSVMQNSRLSWPPFSGGIAAYKIFTDMEFIYSMLRMHLAEEEFCDLQATNGLNLMFPSAVWLPEKNMYLVVVRLFLKLSKSFLYTSFFDSDWNEIITEDTVGATQVPGILPIEVYDYNVFCSGPEDPRMFKYRNEVYVIYNMIDVDLRRKMWLYQFETGETWPLEIIEHTWGTEYAEKNWTPFIIDDEHLYIIYNHKNFQVLDCTHSQKELCKRVSGEPFSLPAGLRGGSPYVRFGSSNYFVSLGYSHLKYKKGNDCCVFYRPTLTIATKSDQDKFDLIFQSEPIDFQNLLIEPFTKYNSTDHIRICDQGRIMMALSIANWDYDDDVLDITLNLNDNVAVAAKVNGLTDLVLDVIAMHENGSLYGDGDCVEKLVYRHFDFEDPEISARNSLRRRRMKKTAVDNY